MDNFLNNFVDKFRDNLWDNFVEMFEDSFVDNLGDNLSGSFQVLIIYVLSSGDHKTVKFAHSMGLKDILVLLFCFLQDR